MIKLGQKKKLIVSQALPHLFQMPLISLFSDLNKKKVASFIFFRCQNQNISIFMLKMNKEKGASLCFDQIKNKKVASSVFWEIKNKNKNLPASSIFHKSGLRNTCLFFFNLIALFLFNFR